MNEFHEALCLLGERHVHDLTDYEEHVIAAICIGWKVNTIAEGLGVKPRTLYRHLQELAARVLDPTGIDATRDFLRTWAELQSSCCTAPAFRLVRGKRV